MMKSGRTTANLITRGIFILTVLCAAWLLFPASYAAEKDDEYLISLPEKKPATTKPRITTQKKEIPAQPAEPAKPISRQSLLGGRGAETSESDAEPVNGRSGLMRGPGSGKRKTDGDEAEALAAERDPSLTRTVTRRSEGTTDYETTTEYDGDTEIETEVVTEHTRGMIVETTTVTEKKGGKVVRRTKSKTTRKEGASSASTDKQTKTILGRATGNTRKNGDAQAAQNTAAKPASTVNTPKTQTTVNNTAKPAPAEKKPEATTPPEQAEEPVEETVPTDEATKEPEPVQTADEPEPAGETAGTVPDDDKKEPDSEQKSGTVANPFGVVRPNGGDQK